MILKIIGFILLIAASSYLYRRGGTSAGTKWRDLGCPTVFTVALLLFFHFHWTMILSFGLLFASLTTYFKKKGEDANLVNWLLVGIAISLSIVPFVIANHLWLGFFTRSIVLTALIMGWSELVKNDVLEELGRGALITATIPLLLIG